MTSCAAVCSPRHQSPEQNSTVRKTSAVEASHAPQSADTASADSNRTRWGAVKAGEKPAETGQANARKTKKSWKVGQQYPCALTHNSSTPQMALGATARHAKDASQSKVRGKRQRQNRT